MSIIDKKLLLTGVSGQNTTDQAVTASAATTDVIDTGDAGISDIGSSDQLYMVVICTETATSAGATTVDIALQDSADDSTFATVSQIAAVPKASITAGTQWIIPVPPGMRRYIRGYFTVNTANLTAGKFRAFITDNYQRNVAKPDSSNIGPIKGFA